MDDFSAMQGIVTLPIEQWIWLRREARYAICCRPIIFIEAEIWPYETFYCGEIRDE